MPLSTLLIVALGAALAGFVQGLSGFGFGLTALSVWAWVIDPTLAAVLSVAGSLGGQLVAALKVRRGFDLSRLAPFILGGLAGIPIGVALLPRLDIDWFKAILGGLLVVWCPAMLFAKDLPRITVGGRAADTVVGFAGGVLGGLGGFSGVLPTLWCTLRGYERDVQRNVIQNFNLSMLMAIMIAYLVSGVVRPPMLPILAVVLLAMLIPTLVGTRLYAGISEAGFRRLVLGLLTVSGVAMLASALPKLI